MVERTADKKRLPGITAIALVEIYFSIPKFIKLIFPLMSGWIDKALLGLIFPVIILAIGILTYRLKNIGRIMNLILLSAMFIVPIPMIINPHIRPDVINTIALLFAAFFEPTYGFFPVSLRFYIVKILPLISIWLIFYLTRPKVKEQFKK